MTRPAVLVSGGAKRLGAAIVRAFADAGWHTIIHYHHSGEDAEQLAAELPSAETVSCDLADGNACVAMIEMLASSNPDWRVLVNSASIFIPDDVTALDLYTNNQSMQINAGSPARMTQAFLEHTISPGGRCVIHITDQKLANPNPDFFSYTMSKHALAATIPMLAMGAGHQNDRVYGLAPGAILPSHDQSPAEAKVSHRMNLLKRYTGSNEIAEAALFLASGYMESGQTLFVDSGQHLLQQERDVIYLARQEEELS